jgi:hypothetical protein
VKTAEEETALTQCGFSPGKVPKIAVTGFNILKVYRLENSKLVEEIIPNPSISNVVCHCWLTDTILFCSNSGGNMINVTTDRQESVLADRRDFKHRDSTVCWIVHHKRAS